MRGGGLTNGSVFNIFSHPEEHGHVDDHEHGDDGVAGDDNASSSERR